MNKQTRAMNGNGMSSLKLSHWNLGNRFWINKTVEIQHFLDTKRPDVLFISEANIFNEDQDYRTWIPGYRIENNKSIETMGYSRLVVLVKDGIQMEVEN